MATSVGQINFGVGIDASSITAEINRQLAPAMAAAQRRLNQNPLTIPVKVGDIDTAGAVRRAQAALRRADLQVGAKVSNVDFTAALRRAQAQLNAANIEVRARARLDSNIRQEEVDRLKEAATQLRAFGRLSDKTVRAQLSTNISEADIKKLKDIGPTLRSLRTATDTDIKVKVDVQLSDADVQKLKDIGPTLRSLKGATDKDIKVRVNVDMSDEDVAKLKELGPSLRAIRGLSDKDITVKIDLQVDEAQLARVAAAMRELRAMRDRRFTIDVDSSSAASASSTVASLKSTLSSLGSSVGAISAVGAALAGILGAAGAAAGAVGGLVGALAAVGPAAAAVGATAVVGLQGVGDAFSALTDITANAASDARSQADSVSAAQDALASATDSATAAQESLASAQDNAADAAKAVGDAYKTAQERLDGYNQSLKESALDEKEAALDLAEARKKLATQKFTDPLERERAVLAVQRAEINLQKAQDAGKKLQDEANDAQQKGIDQAPEVLAAKKAQAQADQQVVQAQRGVEAASRAVAAASKDLADAQSGAGTASEKFSDALANLSPNAQAFVLAAKGIQPALEASRKAIQDSLFQDLGDQLTKTANVALPALTEGMKGVAGELNGIAQGILEFTRSETGITAINASFAGAKELLSGMRVGAEGFGQTLADIATTALPHLAGIGQALGGIGTSISKAFDSAAKSGALDQILTGFEGTLNGLSNVLGPLITQLLDIGAKVLPSLGPLFSALGNVVTTIGPALGDIGKTFADSLTRVMPTLGRFLDALIKGLEPVLPILADLLISVGDALIPLIDPLSQVLQAVGTSLVDAITALAPSIGPLAQAFADLVTALSPILPVIAQLATTLITALAPAFSDIVNALAPVIKSLADQLGPVIAQLAPVLAQMAATIGKAVVDAINQLAPLLPQLITSFTNLVLAVVPLLPQLVELAVQVIPPLVDAMLLVAPVTIAIIDALTWLVEKVLPLVMLGIQGMSDIWGTMTDNVHAGVTWLTDTVFPALGTALDTVKGWFSTAVDAIGTIWDGLKSKAATPINFVIDAVWNNGLLKAWSAIDGLLGGVLPDAKPLDKISGFATGGGISGKGSGTSDDILAWLSNGEHVVTAAEVMKAGGQDVVYAIRDMIARGIPFSWDNGRVITDLGRDNLAAYGAQVKVKGIGNVPPEGLFDPLAKVPIPQFATGGAIFPWMYQLRDGHDFAKAQSGKPYQWAGPRFVGDSFDCSGFMAAIAASILGQNPWQRYWATSSFAGYPATGPQGFVKNLTEGSGFAIGVTDDPGGPGGGHTAGELRGIPELNISAARVESGGALGDVHYGRGTDPNSFASLYGLPIGANGFFQPAGGGDQNGPSVGEQSNFLSGVIERILKEATDPVRDLVKSAVGSPPPQIRAIPTAVLDNNTKLFANAAGNAVTNLGAGIGGAWQKAKDLGSDLFHHLTPFDTGGLANGTGFMAKNTIEPERILSPEQTKLFEALVQALTKIGSAGLGAAGKAVQTVTVDLSNASVQALRTSLGIDARLAADQAGLQVPAVTAISEQIAASDATTGELFSQTTDLLERTATSQEEAAQATADKQEAQLLDIAGKLSSDVLGPVLASAVGAGTDFLTKVLDGVSKDVVKAVDGTTDAVQDLGTTIENQPTNTDTPAFGSPGSSFDAISAISDAIQSVATTATNAFNKVRDDIVAAALKQTGSKVGPESRGLLGKDVSGGFLTDFIVQLTGVEIEVRDLLSNTLDEVRQFRGDSISAFDEAGQLISDTAVLVDRNQTSFETAAAEQERIQKALIKAVIKYLIVNVLIPIITAILGAMITLATTAIGAAIGSAIPIIGTAIGAAVGAAVGAALAGLAAVFTSILAVGAGAAIDAFDEGGIAPGLGFMPKNTIAPERVLSPRQTASFERLVQILDTSGLGGKDGNRTVNVGSVNVNGQRAPEQAADSLLSLLNT